MIKFLVDARAGQDSRLLQGEEPPAFFLLDISERIGPEYVLMFDDFLRMAVIQCTLQLMMSVSNPTAPSLLSAEFLLMLIYVLIGVALYWLVVRQVVGFR